MSDTPIQQQTKLDIRKLSLDELQDYFVHTLGQAKFRAKQVHEWLWKKSCTNFEEMSNLSKALREELQAHFEIRALRIDAEQRSNDGTIKIRFALYDGHLIESVLIPVPSQDRFTVCISSQVGCSLSCSFCATGKMKRLRNIEAAEMYEQVARVNTLCLDTYNKPLSNVVYMGMGEPLLNYREVVESVRLINQGLEMSPRRLTISTAGIAKMMHRLADEGLRCNLALSLHAADDLKRNEIMPINEQNNLESLMAAMRDFQQKNRESKLTFEYIAFKDFNDSPEDAQKLLALCKQVPRVKVNVIEYNPVEGVEMTKADEERIDAMARLFSKHNIPLTIRRSRGKDIDAACGQLANKD